MLLTFTMHASIPVCRINWKLCKRTHTYTTMARDDNAWQYSTMCFPKKCCLSATQQKHRTHKLTQYHRTPIPMRKGRIDAFAQLVLIRAPLGGETLCQMLYFPHRCSMRTTSAYAIYPRNSFTLPQSMNAVRLYSNGNCGNDILNDDAR